MVKSFKLKNVHCTYKPLCRLKSDIVAKKNRILGKDDKDDKPWLSEGDTCRRGTQGKEDRSRGSADQDKEPECNTPQSPQREKSSGIDTIGTPILICEDCGWRQTPENYISKHTGKEIFAFSEYYCLQCRGELKFVVEEMPWSDIDDDPPCTAEMSTQSRPQMEDNDTQLATDIDSE